MNVLIIDAHPIWRGGLKRILSTIDKAFNTFEAPEISDTEPDFAALPDLDLVLADIPELEPDPMRRVKSIARSLPNTPLIVFSASENRKHALDAINMGARGFFPKTASQDEFIKGLRHVLEGSIYLSKRIRGNKPTTAQPHGEMDDKPSHIDEINRLTSRQQQTLALLAQGMSNREISRELGISDKTVRFYLSGIFKTLKIENRTQAALVADHALRDTTVLSFRPKKREIGRRR